MITALLISFIFVFFAFLIIILKPNLLFVLFALEIILLGVNTNFVIGSVILDDGLGKYISLILFSVAALDTSIGLILLLHYYNLRDISLKQITIKG